MSYTLITGASSGIGKAMAYKFASKGHDLIIVARRKNALDEIKQDIEAKHGVKVEVIASDLSIPDNAYKLYDDVKKYDINVMINNAGFGDFNNVWEVDVPHMVKMIDLNITSLSILSMLYARDNKDKQSQLINVASVVGYTTMPYSANYSASKFYVTAYTEALALELKAAGAKLQAKVLAPGPVETEFVDVANEKAINKFDASNFPAFHTSEQMADFTYDLYESKDVVGIVNMADMSFSTRGVIHPAFGA